MNRRNSKQGPASLETMHAIHHKVGQELLKRLSDPKKPPSAALLECARKFLADSGVDAGSLADKQDMAEEIESLVSDVPFPSLSDSDREMTRYDGSPRILPPETNSKGGKGG